MAFEDNSHDVRSSAWKAFRSMGASAITSEVIQRLLLRMQGSDDELRYCYWESFRMFRRVSSIASEVNLIAVFLKTCLRKKEIWPMQAMWLAGMILGGAITRSGNRIDIYDDGEPEVMEVHDKYPIEDLVREFTEQKEKVLGTCRLDVSQSIQYKKIGSFVKPISDAVD